MKMDFTCGDAKQFFRISISIWAKRLAQVAEPPIYLCIFLSLVQIEIPHVIIAIWAEHLSYKFMSVRWRENMAISSIWIRYTNKSYYVSKGLCSWKRNECHQHSFNMFNGIFIFLVSSPIATQKKVVSRVSIISWERSLVVYSKLFSRNQNESHSNECPCCFSHQKMGGKKKQKTQKEATCGLPFRCTSSWKRIITY